MIQYTIAFHAIVDTGIVVPNDNLRALRLKWLRDETEKMSSWSSTHDSKHFWKRVYRLQVNDRLSYRSYRSFPSIGLLTLQSVPEQVIKTGLQALVC